MAKKDAIDIGKLQDAVIRKLPLNEQQIHMIKESQAALAQMNAQASTILGGVVAAAGLDKVKLINVNFDEAYLEVEIL